MRRQIEPQLSNGEGGGRRGDGQFALYALIVGAVWLAWEIVKAPVVVRGPPTIALRLSSTSPEALQRAAEIELAESRVSNAHFLAGESLRLAPFNARALRVRGLAEARMGDEHKADELLTLAGNWSLRDDLAHSWLISYRLRSGDYQSAFAHADTLARRRPDLYFEIFNLFTIAAEEDPRALPELVKLLAAAPPWRPAYWGYLHPRKDGARLLASLVVELQRSSAPLTDSELRELYAVWAGQGHLPALLFVRERIERPSLSVPVQNSDMSIEPDHQILPFGWQLGTAPGMSSSIEGDDERDSNMALRISYDSLGSENPAEQMLFLPPGPQRLAWDLRVESGPRNLPLTWTIVCIESGTQIGAAALNSSGNTMSWDSHEYRFVVPTSGCTAQRLVIEPRTAEQKMTTVLWIDNVSIRSH